MGASAGQGRSVHELPDRIEQVIAFARDLWHELRADRVTGLAAELAFFGVLALFPGLLAVTAALGSLGALIGADAAAEVRDEVVAFLQRVLTDRASDTVDAVRSLFEEGSPGLLTFGLVATVWTASRGVAALMNALHVVYDLDERRSYLRQRGVAVVFSVLTFLVAAVLLSMVVIGPALGSASALAADLGFGDGFITFWSVLRWPFVVLVLVAWATALYHVAPNHRTPWRWDLTGAVAATAFWLLATLGLRGYLAVAAGANRVFGSLGGALIVLIWLYLLALGVLIGGEINAILATRHRVPQPGRE